MRPRGGHLEGDGTPAGLGASLIFSVLYVHTLIVDKIIILFSALYFPCLYLESNDFSLLYMRLEEKKIV